MVLLSWVGCGKWEIPEWKQTIRSSSGNILNVHTNDVQLEKADIFQGYKG